MSLLLTVRSCGTLRSCVIVLALAVAIATGLMLPMRAQDTTQKYPWRLSYFPYPTLSPNAGLMGRMRAVWFRQSRWDDRVSVDDQVSVEAGYSTRDAWIMRADGYFPRLAPGWRLTAGAAASRHADFFPGLQHQGGTQRDIMSADFTRVLGAHWRLALAGDAVHLDWHDDITMISFAHTETDLRSRLAVVFDARGREYDTRHGVLLQAGVLAGSAADGYTGWYAMGDGWLPIGSATRMLIRGAYRTIAQSDSPGRTLPIDASRMVPAWEHEFVIGGGPESNRGLPIGAQPARNIGLASVELRHDLAVFPGGALAVVAFVDATYAATDAADATGTGHGDWATGPGVGLALRLLRNAVLTGTVARANDHTRVYISSGWTW